tara:strand:+ start:758 stop:1015 length:258 start_codon:yes stop_codon:yes gene_type:complete
MIDKIKIFKQYGGDEKNSGSTESQIALFTERIKDITSHLKSNKKDKKTQRSLQLLVGKRRKMLEYLKSKDINKYREIIQKLKLRR